MLKQIRFANTWCNVVFGKYLVGGANSIVLTATVECEIPGEHFCTASVNVIELCDTPLEDNEVAIKNWSECEGIEDALIIGDVIQDQPIRTVQSGFVNIPIYRVSDRCMALLHKERERSNATTTT